MTDASAGTRNPWDLTLTLRVSEVNKILAAHPIADSFTVAEDPKEQLPYHGHGGIAGWSIVPCVPGQDVGKRATKVVNFEVRLSDVTVGGGFDLMGAEDVIKSVRVYVALTLTYVRATEDSATHQLKIAPLPKNDDEHTVTDVSVNVDDLEALGKGDLATLLQTVFSRWLQDNIDKLSHVFAEIDLFDAEAQAGKSWLKPTAVDYAYSPGDTAETSALCVLAMTQGRTPDHDMDFAVPNDLAPGCNAKIYVRDDVFLGSAILPNVHNLAPAATEDMFEYVAATKTVQLKDGREPALGSIKNDGIDCPSLLTKFTLKPIGPVLQCQAETSTLVKFNHLVVPPYTGDANYAAQSYTYVDDLCHSNVSQTLYLTLGMTDPDASGRRRFALTEDKSRTQIDRKSVPIEKSEFEKVLDTVNMIEMTLLNVVPGYGTVMFLIWLGVKTGFDLAKIDKIDDDKNLGQTLNLNALNEAITLRWKGFSTIDITHAGLDGGLVLAGATTRL